MAKHYQYKADEPPRLCKGRVSDAWLAYHLGCTPANVWQFRKKMKRFPNSSPDRALKLCHGRVGESYRTKKFNEPAPAVEPADDDDVDSDTEPSVPVGSISPDIDHTAAPEDFDELVVWQAQQVVKLAFQHYEAAIGVGAPARISLASRNWSEATKRAAEARKNFLEVQVAASKLIRMDVAKNIVDTELRTVMAAFTKLGDTVATTAEQRAAINEAVDKILANIDSVRAKIAGDFNHVDQSGV